MAKEPCNVGQGLLQNTNPYRRERPVEHLRSHDYSIGCKQEDCPRWLRRSASAGWHILFQDGCRARIACRMTFSAKIGSGRDDITSRGASANQNCAWPARRLYWRRDPAVACR